MPTRVIQRPMNAVEWGFLILLSMVWGGSFFFNQVAVAELPPLTIVAVRVAGAALILVAALPAFGVALPRDGRVWAAFLTMGLLNNAIPFTLIVWGQTQIASGVAAILNASTPVFAVILAHFLTADEPMTARRLGGVLLGLGGVAAMVGGSAVEALGGEVLAKLAVLGAATSYAVAGIYGRRFRAMGVAPMATATGQVAMSSLILIPLALVADRPWTLAAPSAAAVGSLAGIAAISTALAYVIYFRLLASAGATNLLLVTLLVPVTAILLGVAFLGEVLMPRHMAGMALIAAGLIAIDGRLFRRRAALPPVRGL
jgi:drug/metabolite transporter (DMT)-like permease